MRKTLTKIICLACAAVVALGVTFVSACSGYKPEKLDGDISGTVSTADNGGFVVKKGNYIYFINGKESYDKDNTPGAPVKGSIMRISASDFSERKYSSAQTVVPQIAYSGNSNAGIFIYGDYVYFSTPSTDKNSEGEVQNTYLSFKKAKLDGSEISDYFVQYSDNTIEYRFVNVGNTVYLLYAAKNENLYGTSTGYTNIHSVNTLTGENTLLAYNVESYIFDKTDLTNPRIYYTMKVQDFVVPSNSPTYNQIYTVKADETERNAYNFDEVEDYDAEKDPLYVNCGDLVLDGIGNIDEAGQFNGPDADKVIRKSINYKLSNYQNGELLYTVTRKGLSENKLYSLTDEEVLKEGWQPVKANDDLSRKCLLTDGSSAGSYYYIYDGQNNIETVFIPDTNGILKTKQVDGEIVKDYNGEDSFYLNLGQGQSTVLFIDKTDGYIYYSLTGGSGYKVNRIKYTGSAKDYHNPFSGDVTEYTPVSVLDIDSASDWYKPELVDGQLLFATQTTDMTNYPYVMACDLRVRENGVATDKVMSNVEIDKLNKQYEKINEKIEEIDESIHANLKNALKYVSATGDKDYIGTLIGLYDEVEDGATYKNEEGEDVTIVKYTLTEDSLKIVDRFYGATDEYSEFADEISVNGTKYKANRKDYYYSVLGKMSEDDAESYGTYVKKTYLKEEPPVTEESWYEGLTSGGKAGFIIGVTAGGLIVIAGIVFAVLYSLKKRRQKAPVQKKKRVKVDTTDDKDIDVYNS